VGVNGHKGPKPYKQRRTSTLFLRVPTGDWPKVKRGIKQEFRAQSGIQSQLHKVVAPMPVVAYAVDRRGRHDARLMVLTAIWREPLGAISPESLEAEGCRNLGEFRRYWIARDKRRFTPTAVVAVYRVRPWRDELDDRLMADRLLHHLYGEWVGDEIEEEVA
jgi:hypothetical protein